ncbi:MAG TPA: ATP-binding protein [Synergistaceae bacterium]|nr:ATP-binding protein [Synergistaceae bacterium]
MNIQELEALIAKGESPSVGFEELLRLFEKAGSFHFDVSPVADTTIKDLNLERIRDYFLQYNAFDLFEESRESMERILVNGDILTEAEGSAACTLGGLLIFGIHPEKFLPQNGISFAHFKGTEITDALIDKKNVLGRLPDVAEQMMVILQNNMMRPSVIEGAQRIEQEEYPLLALREAVVNALVHRNYGIWGSKIRIFMFEDRIEFRSPGRLPNTVSVEKMKVGVSYARNPFLVKYMENLRYIDQLGRGIPMIFSAMKKMGAKEPLLMEQGEEFLLRLYRK